MKILTRTENRWVCDIEFQTNLMATGARDFDLYLAKTSTPQMLLTQVTHTVDIQKEAVLQKLMNILGIQHLNTDLFRRFLEHALIPQGFFVTHTVPSFTFDLHPYQGGGAFGAVKWM